MKKSDTKPVAYAFIDSQNLNLGVQKAGWKIDWIKFRKFLEQEYNVPKAYLFIGYISENEAMYNQLYESGYLIVLKPTVETTVPPAAEQALAQTTPAANNPDAADAPVRKPIVKGNIDAELVLYAMKEMPNYQKAIIVSGDGDFYCLAEYLAGKNRLLHLMTPNWQYSSLLKPYEKYIVRIDQLRKQLEHRDYRGRKKKPAQTAKP